MMAPIFYTVGHKGITPQLVVKVNTNEITEDELRKLFDDEQESFDKMAADISRIAGVLERLERFFIATSVSDVEAAIETLEAEGV